METNARRNSFPFDTRTRSNVKAAAGRVVCKRGGLITFSLFFFSLPRHQPLCTVYQSEISHSRKVTRGIAFHLTKFHFGKFLLSYFFFFVFCIFFSRKASYVCFFFSRFGLAGCRIFDKCVFIAVYKMHNAIEVRHSTVDDVEKRDNRLITVTLNNVYLIR